ncbi:PilZ domain-containing protein [Halobacillus massiliensis]|uniref:PilZ domain-containing protein n=1 Tax=Halobacillus massiliensis TaxID=1926286 RepID=UPI0009E5C31E|nr:PilZ domain-containing protein [Halobacillus massiliensis]
MRYNRQESLRYTFGHPPEASFTILDAEDFDLVSTMGKGSILNMSPNGMLLATDLKLPVNQKIQLLIETTLFNQHSLICKAEIVWAKPWGSKSHYGLQLLDDKRDQIIKILKDINKTEK